MRRKAHGQVRRSQLITTWGPGALLDLPQYAVIVGGLDFWPKEADLETIDEPRLVRGLERITSTTAPRLYAPPAASDDPTAPSRGVGVWRFPQWFVVQEERGGEERERSRRLVHRTALDDRGRFERRPVVPTRFVRSCPKGHVDDLDWRYFVHPGDKECRRQLWLDERGTSGDLADLAVRCECGKPSRSLYEATQLEMNPLGTCSGARPWLGQRAHEPCNLPSRLLIRTAANAYFSQIVSVLSLPNRATAVQEVVDDLWDDLQIVDDLSGLKFLKRKPAVAQKLAKFDDDEVLNAIAQKKTGDEGDRSLKQVELEAILSAREGFGDDVPIDPIFHARRLPDRIWRRSDLTRDIECVVQLHRLREVLALAGFSRLEPIVPNIHGEYDSDVERAELSLEPAWYPAIENRGEGVFIQLRDDAVNEWLRRPAVATRLDQLSAAHDRWVESRKSKREFPGGPYILLHTLSHLLMQTLSMRCGYPASSIRERIFVEPPGHGILLYTASPDADGTLGGLVQQARHIESHLSQALQAGSLCSNDPICAQHRPGESMEGRPLHGAACHGCALVAETSCEMRNDYLDRALVVPTLATGDACFFGDFR